MTQHGLAARSSRGRPRSRGDLRRMTIDVRSAGENLWEIPRRRRDARARPHFSRRRSRWERSRHDPCLQQVVNVAHLPGIVGYALAMPDIHWGYGFRSEAWRPTRLEDGVISPGGVGYDINCGVRLVRTRLAFEEVRDRIPDVVRGLAATIPAGVGASGAITPDASRGAPSSRAGRPLGDRRRLRQPGSRACGGRRLPRQCRSGRGERDRSARGALQWVRSAREITSSKSRSSKRSTCPEVAARFGLERSRHVPRSFRVAGPRLSGLR